MTIKWNAISKHLPKCTNLVQDIFYLAHRVYYKQFAPTFTRISLVAQTVKLLPAVWETRVRSLGWEDPLEKEMATHSSNLAWKIPWTEEPGGLQSMESQRVGHDWETSLSPTFTILRFYIKVLWVELSPPTPKGYIKALTPQYFRVRPHLEIESLQ